MMKNKKLARSIALVFLLVVTFAIVTYAVLRATTRVSDHFVQTGEISITFDTETQIFDGVDYNLEPGASVVQTLSVKNVGTGALYFRLYFENVEGIVSDQLTFNFYDEDGALVKSVSAKEFTSDNYLESTVALEVGETVEYEVIVTMGKSAGNTYQDQSLTFDIVALAVQSKNNDAQEFA